MNTFHSVSLTVMLLLGVSFNAYSDSKNKSERSSRNSEQLSLDFDAIREMLILHETGAVEATIDGHVSQEELESLEASVAFEEAFELGDELFEITYNALDGVGANVGNGSRFTSVPRLDLDDGEAWADVTPLRVTGPNGDSCIACHEFPVADGAGLINDNVVRIDPERAQSGFIERQSPHLHGMGAQQLLAEEMTTTLQSLRDAAVEESCATDEAVTVSMIAKTVDFGTIRVNCDRINYRNLDGVDNSLVIKPFEWKGLTLSSRNFARDAMHQELGMQAVELVGDSDSDFDGISSEISVGDITALSVYIAAQPRPVTKLELNQIIDQLDEEVAEGFGLPLDDTQIASIQNGEQVFEDLQCSTCHVPALIIDSPTFYEPSQHPDFRDDVFPAGDDVPMPSVAVQFSLTDDLPNNPEILPSGQTLGVFEKTEEGGAIVRLYGDLKRHDMGASLAETIDERGLGSSVFITETLWGVGATPPYLHDGRATTLTEAIMLHGGEAEDSKEAFEEAVISDQEDLLAFLDNLVLILD